MGLFFYTKKGSIISTVDLPTTEIIEPIFTKALHSTRQADKGYFQFSKHKVFSLHLVLASTIWEIVEGWR